MTSGRQRGQNAAMKRLPKGYRGIDHETIGSDVISILKVLHAPDMILGANVSAQLRAVKPDGWYPIAMILEPMELLAQKSGDRTLLSVGWKVIQLSHADNIRKNIKSAHQLLHGFDAIYRNANRGTDIGGWKMLDSAPGRAVMEKTTPHHCVMEEGILQEALRILSVPANVVQTSCFRKGADCCVYEVTSVVRDIRWTG
jgi:hypothetical protein